MRKTIGIIGFGFIGEYVFNKIKKDEFMEVGFVFEPNQERTESLDPSIILDTFDAFENKNVDLVIESALPEVAKEFGLRIIKKSDLLVLSLTSFADEAFCERMEQAAKGSGRRIYIPHGGILGLDGIHDGREVIEGVKITTIKNPKNLGLKSESIAEPTVVYEGSTRKACHSFPRNVNVHASLALTGLGFDKTQSKIVADPQTESMTHVIEVTGKGIHWKMHLESSATGQVTGAYTPESIFQNVRRICMEEGGFHLS